MANFQRGGAFGTICVSPLIGEVDTRKFYAARDQRTNVFTSQWWLERPSVASRTNGLAPAPWSGRSPKS
jgi:hypothetical protein